MFLKVYPVAVYSAYNDFSVYGTSDKVEAVAVRGDNKYIFAASSGLKQGYEFRANLTSDLIIKEVRIYASLRSGSASGSAKLGIVSGSNSAAKSFSVGTDWDLFCAVFDKHPSGAEWSSANLSVFYCYIENGASVSLNCDYFAVVIEFDGGFYDESQIRWIKDGDILNEVNLKEPVRQVLQNTLYLRDNLSRFSGVLGGQFGFFLKNLIKGPAILKFGNFANGVLSEPFYAVYNGDIYKVATYGGLAGDKVVLSLRINSTVDEQGFKSGVFRAITNLNSSPDYYDFQIGSYDGIKISYTVGELIDFSKLEGSEVENLITDFERYGYIGLKRVFNAFKGLVKELFEPGVVPIYTGADSNLKVYLSGTDFYVAPGMAILPDGSIYYSTQAVKVSGAGKYVALVSDDVYNVSVARVDSVNPNYSLALAEINGSEATDMRKYAVMRVHAGLVFLGRHSTDVSVQPVREGEVRYSGGKLAYSPSSNDPNAWNVLAVENYVPIVIVTFGSATTGDLKCNDAKYVPLPNATIMRVDVSYYDGSAYRYESFSTTYTTVLGDLLGFNVSKVGNDWVVRGAIYKPNGSVVQPNELVFELGTSASSLTEIEVLVYASVRSSVVFQ